MVTQTRIRSIIRHLNVLNFLLFTLVAALSAYVLPSLLNVKVGYNAPVPKKIVEGKEGNPAAAQPPSPMEYTVVAEQNVFNPERKIPVEKTSDQEKEKLLPKPEFVLYGTLISDDTRVAYLDDLKEKVPAGSISGTRGRRQKTLRVGNNLSGYTLKEVYPDRVVMERGENRIELQVIDSSRAKTRETVGTPSTVAAQRPPVPSAAAVRDPRILRQIKRQQENPH